MKMYFFVVTLSVVVADVTLALTPLGTPTIADSTAPVVATRIVAIASAELPGRRTTELGWSVIDNVETLVADVATAVTASVRELQPTPATRTTIKERDERRIVGYCRSMPGRPPETRHRVGGPTGVSGRLTNGIVGYSAVQRGSVRRYFTSDRSCADNPLEAALTTHEWNARLDGPGNGLGDTWRAPISAVFEALGRTPRRATPYR